MSGTKHDIGKIQLELLPVDSLIEVTKVLQFGAEKYGKWNWSKGLNYTRIIGAILRHTFLYLGGEDKDQESGLNHIAHVACNCLFLIHFSNYKKELDDREKAAYEIG